MIRPEHAKGRIRREPIWPAQRLRCRRKMKQSDVAVLAGISESALYFIENGHSWPPPATILRLATAMRLSPATLTTAILQGWILRHCQPEGRS